MSCNDVNVCKCMNASRQNRAWSLNPRSRVLGRLCVLRCLRYCESFNFHLSLAALCHIPKLWGFQPSLNHGSVPRCVRDDYVLLRSV